jgi:hypothetical protein
MPFTKVWGTTGTNLGTATLWEPISLRSAAYSWTASGSGTNEYYLRTAASGNPGFAAQPNNLYINGANATEGTAGSLTAGQWDYADNDTLGYSTIYVRLSDGTDPDTKTNGYVSFYQTPRATEHIRFPYGAGDASSGLDYSAIASGDVIFDGYDGTIGAATGYAFFDPDKFEFEAQSGQAFIDIGAAAIAVQIKGTGSAAAGDRGLWLRGTGITVLNITGGSVGIAARAGELSTVTTARVLNEGSSLWIGSGCGLTTLHVYGGEVRIRAAGLTTVIQYGGTVYLEEAASVTTYTQKGGTAYWNSTGTIGTLNGYGGTWDEQQYGAARTCTTTNLYSGNWALLLNKEAVTRTNAPTINDSLILNVSG